MRRYSAAKTAKREKSFREHVARKSSPIRFATAIPEDIDLLDIDWKPSREERLLDWIQDKQECEQAEPDPS